jgi:1-pyrroline-5-carboxylate dehydrogenase
VADRLTGLLREKLGALKVGDPSRRENWMGPVTTASAYDNFAKYCERLRDGGKILAGGFKLRDGELAHGFYVAPTLAEAPATHPLFEEEMFLPILMLCRVKDRDEAMRLTNASALGLTAGCYGNDSDIEFFFDNVEAGVTYANRAQGATTGAWPGYQPFGGWKGSGSTGKAIASFYYLALYQREQSQTRVE